MLLSCTDGKVPIFFYLKDGDQEENVNWCFMWRTWKVSIYNNVDTACLVHRDNIAMYPSGSAPSYSPDSTVININSLQLALFELIFERLLLQMLCLRTKFNGRLRLGIPEGAVCGVYISAGILKHQPRVGSLGPCGRCKHCCPVGF